MVGTGKSIRNRNILAEFGASRVARGIATFLVTYPIDPSPHPLDVPSEAPSRVYNFPIRLLDKDASYLPCGREAVENVLML